MEKDVTSHITVVVKYLDQNNRELNENSKQAVGLY